MLRYIGAPPGRSSSCSDQGATSPKLFPSAARHGETVHSCPAALPCHRSTARVAAGPEPSGPITLLRSSRARFPTGSPSFPAAVGCARPPVPGLLPPTVIPPVAPTRPSLCATSPSSRLAATPSALTDSHPPPFPRTASLLAAIQSDMVSS